MKINKSTYIYTILFFIICSIGQSQSISSYRRQFNDAIVLSNDSQGKETLQTISILLDRFRTENPTDEDGSYFNKKLTLYLDIWEIKKIFLSGDIQTALEKFDILKDDPLLGGNLPYFKQIKVCRKDTEECGCEDGNLSILEDLDPKIDNLDFLRDIYIDKYFIDFAIEINNGKNSSIAIKEGAHVLYGKNRVEFLLSRPKTKIALNAYDKGKAKKNDVIDYYLKAAQKRILEGLDANFRNKKGQKLEFYTEYQNTENGSINYRCMIKNIPKISGGLSDANSQDYKIYIMEDDIARDRYSITLNDVIGNKINLKTLLINWNLYWTMQKWKDEDHIFFLFPLNYGLDYKIQGKLVAGIDGYDGEELSKIITKVDQNSFQFSDLPEDYKERFNITDDESIEVYKVSVKYDKNSKVNLSYTDEYDENEEIKNEKKWLFRVIIGCLAALFFL